MIPGDLGQIREKVAYLVNFNSGQLDQDFRGTSGNSNKNIDAAINEAYTEECALAKSVASRDWFRRTLSFTWPADAASISIPAALRDRDIEVMRDDTSETPGPMVTTWDGVGVGSGLWRIDDATWGFYPTPSSAMTITAIYIAEPVELANDGDEPTLIPAAFRDLLVWSAGIVLKGIADEDPPRFWLKKQNDWRFLFQKQIALGQPRQYPPVRVKNIYGDI